MRPGDSLPCRAGGQLGAAPRRRFGTRPRVRSGYALKRLEAAEGPQALGAAGPGVGPLPADVRHRRRAVRAARRHGIAARAGRARRSGASARPGRRGWRGCWPSSPSAGSWPGVAGAEAAAASRPGSRERLVHAAREDVGRGRRRCSTRLYRQRRLAAVHAPGAGGDRRARAWSGSSSSPIWSSARYGTPFVVAQKIGIGGARVPARPLRGRGRARDRARAHDGVVRPPGAEGRAEAAADLPVRVRGHVARRGSSRGGAGSRSARPGRSPTSRSARCSRSAASRCPAGTVATSSSSSPSPPTSARSST